MNRIYCFRVLKPLLKRYQHITIHRAGHRDKLIFIRSDAISNISAELCVQFYSRTIRWITIDSIILINIVNGVRVASFLITRFFFVKMHPLPQTSKADAVGLVRDFINQMLNRSQVNAKRHEIRISEENRKQDEK